MTAPWETRDGTATAPEDYEATNGNLVFAPGETEQTIRVHVRDDPLIEQDEEFAIVLSDVANARAPAPAVGEIVDNDAAPGSADNPLRGLTIRDASAREDAGSVAFTVTLGAASERTVTVNWQTADGTAQAGTDYTAGDGRLVFDPGQIGKTIRVPVLDDALDEADETFTVTLSAANDATLADAQATGTIIDDDASVVQAWLARFGRTVADHVLGAVGERMAGEAGPGSRVTVAGQRLDEASTRQEPHWQEAGWAGPQARTEGAARSMGGRELLAGSSFRLALATDAPPAREQRPAPAAARRAPGGRSAAEVISSWGAADSRVERLWSVHDAAGLSANDAAVAAGRLDAELRYGMDGLTPYAGVGLADGEARAWRLGSRFDLGRSVSVSVEGSLREHPGAAPEHALELSGTVRW